MDYHRTAIRLLLTISIIFTAGCENRDQDLEKEIPIVGVKVYDVEGDYRVLFDEWRELGVNTVFSSVSLLSNDSFSALAEQNDISTFIILPIFYNAEALSQDSSLYAITNLGEKAIDDWVTFICPSREDYRQQQTAYIKQLVRDLDPDGLSIDFIRHFVFWEMVYPDRDPASIATTCFDEECLERFQRETGISIPDSIFTTVEKATWIEEHHQQAWTDWRCRLITDMIAEIAREARALKPDILINVHAVPWREDDFDGAAKRIAGQDLSQIVDHVDYISPMTYFHMVKQPPAWVHDVVLDMHRQTDGNVLPSIQVGKAYLDESLSVDDFHQALDEALQQPSKGVVFWSWEALSQSADKKEAVKEILGRPG